MRESMLLERAECRRRFSIPSLKATFSQAAIQQATAQRMTGSLGRVRDKFQEKQPNRQNRFLCAEI